MEPFSAQTNRVLVHHRSTNETTLPEREDVEPREVGVLDRARVGGGSTRVRDGR